jgi:hypothetical protein
MKSSRRGSQRQGSSNEPIVCQLLGEMPQTTDHPRAYSRIDVRLERRDAEVDDAHTLFGPEKIRRLDLAVEHALARRRSSPVAVSSAARPSVFDREGLPIDHLANSAPRHVLEHDVGVSSAR